jgi:hypothetical protein
MTGSKLIRRYPKTVEVLGPVALLVQEGKIGNPSHPESASVVHPRTGKHDCELVHRLALNGS